MLPVGLIPPPLLPAVCRLASLFVRKDVEKTTGLSEEGWNSLARTFPDLGPNPGLDAARTRAIMGLLFKASIKSRSPLSTLHGAPLSPTPTLYLTAHLGNLHMLRWELRRRGFAAAQVLGPENFDREKHAQHDESFDRLFPSDFPHVVRSDRIFDLRAALKVGSLIIALDRPGAERVEMPLLGGRIPLDPRPIRLAKLMGVPARPAFLTAPKARAILTIGDPVTLDDPQKALEEFASGLAETARESPNDFDGFTHRYLAHIPPP